MSRAYLTIILLAAALSWGAASDAAPQGGSRRVVTIRMMSDRTGADVWFDPIGVYVEPGTTVRWVIDSNVHSTVAYHPRNNRSSLRIPRGVAPWDSTLMARPGQRFEVTLTVPGTYDYFCAPHEGFGMVGRIVVGARGGPGDLPFDYFKGDPGARDWRPVPLAAQRALPPVERIVREKIVHRPAPTSSTGFPKRRAPASCSSGCCPGRTARR